MDKNFAVPTSVWHDLNVSKTLFECAVLSPTGVQCPQEFVGWLPANSEW